MPLFTALSVQHVMIFQLIYPKMPFPVLVIISFFFSLPFQVGSQQPSIEIVPIFLVATLAYHAGLNNKLRTSVLDDWLSSKIQVVIATVAFG